MIYVPEASTNGNLPGAVPSSHTNSSILRPSVFSSSSSSFGSSVSSSQSPIKFGHSSSSNPFSSSTQTNPFKLRPSVFVTADKEPGTVLRFYFLNLFFSLTNLLSTDV